ncbi:hypothetical protein [Neobacillus sp. DY30]|nr:hypothetical protein [Neobacillus sp. DY30]WHY02603.1 hypothetical protein QNH29_10420 [Neobacillus sp. DY30]
MGKIKLSQKGGMNFHYLHYPLDYLLEVMVKYEFESGGIVPNRVTNSVI